MKPLCPTSCLDEGDDRIDALTLNHTLHTSSTTRASWDYKTLVAPAADYRPTTRVSVGILMS